MSYSKDDIPDDREPTATNDPARATVLPMPWFTSPSNALNSACCDQEDSYDSNMYAAPIPGFESVYY